MTWFTQPQVKSVWPDLTLGCYPVFAHVRSTSGIKCV